MSTQLSNGLLARRRRIIENPMTLTLPGINASSTGSTITIPGTAQAGDIAVFSQYAFSSGGTPTAVEFSGATTVNNVAGGPSTVRRVMISYKVLTAGDIGAALTGMNSSSNLKSVRIIRPSKPITSITTGDVFGFINSGSGSSSDTIGPAPSGPAFLFARLFMELTISITGTLPTYGDRYNENGNSDFPTWIEIQNGPTLSSRTIGQTASTGNRGDQGFYAVVT
ncbi:hypothetical protein [Kaistia nematophila]|uniref:Uncharacterized protein n=1 Tax=Kaistia nematophila TaxID=2994654 RepID=A0A9X3E1W0_9HYPH|nr:hypothetical protein [Kaistia nematophila]MCX5569588.1 hypothetical protein [Kaistia nematophila]